ncbi:dihydroorotate dehydrogenase-like protein [Skermanella rosea]|uniref:dihydroorotate dehydrogenase-like protein n=1 Tax=Skermanella rosea TaxID=1817965 RepID=UPI0019317207|nr:dihydroorotate dehydrogenase-like protein [Skermanella rosea]UEM03473.1 dihydroorotate dehydrogenase-like protein [Skermanella rosea]
MDLRTRYLGFELPHPIMPGASPLVDDLDMVRRLEDAGASAIVMHSLFEEQISGEQLAAVHAAERPADSFAEALSYLPPLDGFALGPEGYLEQIRRIKGAVGVPVIASLNGVSRSGWIRYAKLMEEAGADALELNVYAVAADPNEPGQVVEDRLVGVAVAVRRAVAIPVAVKLSPFFSSVAAVVRRLEDVGIDGVVLFNRFYQPDIDIEALEVTPRVQLSDPSELLLRLHWLAILSGRIRPALAASGGVHRVEDVVKAVMAGAHAVQTVSALLRHGPEHLTVLKDGLRRWMEERDYASLEQMQGSMNLRRCPDPAAFERANYMRVLQGWRADG